MISLALVLGGGCGGCDDDDSAVVLHEPRDRGDTGGVDERDVEGVLPLDPAIETRADARRALWRKSDLQLGFVPPRAPDRKRMERLVEILFAMDAGDDEAADRALDLARTLELELEAWRVDGVLYWVLTEPIEYRRGAGAYVIRAGARSGPPVVLQAPHTYYEYRTADIAASLFFGPEGRYFDALFTNSLHRYQSEPGERQHSHDSAADVCHNADHWFVYATRGAGRALDSVAVVQLHGFAETGRDVASEVYSIVSGGERDGPTPLSRHFAEALRADFGRGALLYPEDTDRLGGTTNEEAVVLRALPGTAFLHVELGRAFREQLATDDGARKRFADALLVALERARASALGSQ